MRSRTALRMVLVAWLAAVVPRAGVAATYDPDLTWRTIVTEHFRIHFHQGEEQLAEELSHKVEEIYATMSAELQWRARMKTEVVLIDRTDSANGFATAVPYNSITIFVTAPQEDSTLSLYEDWAEAIFTHELTHVLHMETHRGLVAVARAIVGRIASTNDVSPWWMIEGLATFQETRHTSGGRGRNPIVAMIERAAVVDDQFPPLGNLDGIQADPPGGNLRYLFGQDFMQYVADHTGRDVWTRWTHTYGGHIPYLLPTKRTFGRKLQGLYYDWRAELFERTRRELAPVEAEGIREGVLVSDGRASCTAPSFAPDDSRLVWSCYDRATGSAIWTAEPDGSGARKLVQDFGARTFTWRADGQAFVYAANHIVNRFNTWSDIYLYDLRTGGITALTRGARARDPDFSPDGARLLMVTNRVQDNQLETLTVDQRRTRLTDHTDHTQYSTPRHHPSGAAVAVSIWEHGRRDLWLVSPEGARLRRLTADAANDRDPAWSADGRWLFFSSDRTGIPNIYAIDTRTERLWQVTHVRTGASRPSISPDFTRLAYEQYSADGFDVRLLGVDPAQWLDRGLLPTPITGGAPLAELLPATWTPVAAADVPTWEGAPLGPMRRPGPAASALAADPQSTDSIDTFEQTEVEDAFGEEADYPFTIPPRRYDPWPSLVPRYWIPTLQVTPRLFGLPPRGPFAWLSTLPRPFNIPGLQIQGSTGATDPLRHYAWSGFVQYRTDANFFGGGGSFTLNRWLPVFTVGASTVAVPRTYAVFDAEATLRSGELTRDALPRSYFERRITSFLNMSYPFTPRSTVFANYTFSHRKILSPLDPAVDPETLALRGTLGQLAAGYRYSWSQQTPYAVSREDARTLSIVGSLAAPWLGTFATTGDLRTTPYRTDREAPRDVAGVPLPDTLLAPWATGDAVAGTPTREGLYQVQLSAELREYVVMPWLANHVLAMRAATGVSFGTSRFLGNYTLGGNIGDSAFYVRPAEYRMIRGYPFGADRGDNYWLLSAEYRFPIVRMDRGFGTVPAFLRVLHGAVFVDAGNAFNRIVSFVDIFDDSLVGVGAELRLDTVLFWSSSFDFRLGYATGLTQNGYGPSNPRTVYLQLGSAF